MGFSYSVRFLLGGISFFGMLCLFARFSFFECFSYCAVFLCQLSFLPECSYLRDFLIRARFIEGISLLFFGGALLLCVIFVFSGFLFARFYFRGFHIRVLFFLAPFPSFWRTFSLCWLSSFQRFSSLSGIFCFFFCDVCAGCRSSSP